MSSPSPFSWDGALRFPQLAPEASLGLLRKLQARDAAVAALAPPNDLEAYLREERADQGARDALLRAVCLLQREDGDADAGELLLAAFAGQLRLLHFRCRKWKRDRHERWQMLFVAFLAAIAGLDFSRPRPRLFWRIVNETRSRLFRSCEREWKNARPVVPNDESEDLLRLAAPERGSPEVGAVLQTADDRAIATQLLRRLHPDDARLLVATLVEGRTVAQVARECGVPYQALKKRRQRLLARLRSAQRLGPAGTSRTGPPAERRVA